VPWADESGREAPPTFQREGESLTGLRYAEGLAGAHFAGGLGRGGGPLFRGGAAEDKKLPEAEEDAESDRHGEKREAVATEGVIALADGPEERGAADAEGGDDAKDAPSDAGFAGAFAAENDAEADADHRHIPHQRKKQTKGIGPGGEAKERDRAYDNKECTGAEGAEGQFFHRGMQARARPPWGKTGASVEGDENNYF